MAKGAEDGEEAEVTGAWSLGIDVHGGEADVQRKRMIDKVRKKEEQQAASAQLVISSHKSHLDHRPTETHHTLRAGRVQTCVCARTPAPPLPPPSTSSPVPSPHAACTLPAPAPGHAMHLQRRTVCPPGTFTLPRNAPAAPHRQAENRSLCGGCQLSARGHWDVPQSASDSDSTACGRCHLRE